MIEEPNPEMSGGTDGSNDQKNAQELRLDEQPMTEAQTSALKVLTEEADEPGVYAENLTEAEAANRIEALQKKLRTDEFP